LFSAESCLQCRGFLFISETGKPISLITFAGQIIFTKYFGH
jgi:hypothetical protein